jgi:putative ABC transport system substrate-binding protein
VEGRLVESWARPGGYLTGVSFLSLALVGKRIELLKEAMPGLKRIAIIARPEHPGEQGELRASQTAAKAIGVALDYEALVAIPQLRCEAMVAFPDATMMRYSERIAAMAIKNRIPAVSGWAEFTERGNLMSYGPNLPASFRRMAYFVDRILEGARPADLPVELPTKFELMVNMKTARALGIVIPQSILLRAERVIE